MTVSEREFWTVLRIIELTRDPAKKYNSKAAIITSIPSLEEIMKPVEHVNKGSGKTIHLTSEKVKEVRDLLMLTLHRPHDASLHQLPEARLRLLNETFERLNKNKHPVIPSKPESLSVHRAILEVVRPTVIKEKKKTISPEQMAREKIEYFRKNYLAVSRNSTVNLVLNLLRGVKPDSPMEKALAELIKENKSEIQRLADRAHEARTKSRAKQIDKSAEKTRHIIEFGQDGPMETKSYWNPTLKRMPPSNRLARLQRRRKR